MMNYLVDDDLPYEREEVHHNRRPREKLWDEAKHHAEARIYDGARLSRLSSILEILNLQAKYKASNVMLDDLFRILHELILPEGNSLPSSWKEAKKVLRTIGMEYEIIHACPNDCIIEKSTRIAKNALNVTLHGTRRIWCQRRCLERQCDTFR